LEEDEIITSFAFHPNCEIDHPIMSITSTTGAVRVLNFNQDFSTWEFSSEEEIINQHAFEAWCCVFSEKGDSKFIT